MLKEKSLLPAGKVHLFLTQTNDIHIPVYQQERTGRVWWIAIAKGRKRHQTGCQRAGLEDCSWDKPVHKMHPPGWALPPTSGAPGNKPTGDPQTSFGHFCHTWGINLLHSAPSPPVTTSADQYFLLHFRLLCNAALYMAPVVSGASCYPWVLCKTLWDVQGCQWLYTSRSLMLPEHHLQTMVARR